MCSSAKIARNVGNKSIKPTKRKRSSRPARLQDYHKPEQLQKHDQEGRSFKEAIIKILPRDFQTILQTLVTLACLYEFLQTKDAMWLLTAYAMVNGSSSLPNVKTLLPYHKESSRKENDVL